MANSRAQDRRVRDVDDEKLVEAKQPRLRRDSFGHGDDWVFLGLPPRGREPGVHVRHELMKVRAPLLLHRDGAGEQVHQHGFAAADGAEDVKPLRHLAAPAREKGEEVRARGRRIIDEPVGEDLQLLNAKRLRAVRRDLAVRQ